MQQLPFVPFWTLASPCLLLLSSLLSETNFLLAKVHLALRLVEVYNFDLHPPTCLNPHHNLFCYHPHVRPLDDQQTHIGISTTTKTPHKKHSFFFPAKRTLNQHTPCLYWSVIRHIKTESSIMSLTFLLIPLHTSTYVFSILHQLQAVKNPPTPPTNYKSNIGCSLKTLGIWES